MDSIAIIIGVVIGVCANLITQALQEFLNNRFNIPRRLNDLEKDLNEVINFYDNRNDFYLKTFQIAFIVIICNCIGNATWATVDPLTLFLWKYFNVGESSVEIIRMIPPLISVLFYTIVVVTSISYLNLLSKIMNFKDYKNSTQKKIDILRNRVKNNQV